MKNVFNVQTLSLLKLKCIKNPLSGIHTFWHNNNTALWWSTVLVLLEVNIYIREILNCIATLKHDKKVLLFFVLRKHELLKQPVGHY